MSVDNGFERLVSCPYEINHQILLSRLQFHLEKCKKNYTKGQRMIECPFNATHKVPEIEINCHKCFLCPDRHKLETFICAGTDSVKLFPIPDIPVQASENWDDVEVPTYNPEDHCKSMPVMTNKIGAKPSERKYHRSEERARWRNITSGPAPSAAASPRPPCGHSRLPQTQSRTFVPHDIRKASIDEGEQREGNVALPSSPAEDADDEGFVTPKYSRGRGRGRMMEK